MAYKNHKVIILFSPAQVPSRRLYAVQGTARHSGCRPTGKIPAAHNRDNQRSESMTHEEVPNELGLLQEGRE